MDMRTAGAIVERHEAALPPAGEYLCWRVGPQEYGVDIRTVPGMRHDLLLELRILSSLDTTRHIVISPDGAIVNSSTSLPCSSGESRSARP